MDTSLKRGIDFRNRLGQASFGGTLWKHLHWWQGKQITWSTLFFLVVVMLVNLVLVFPIFEYNLESAYSSSILVLLGKMFGKYHSQFFQGLTILTLTLAPVSLYFFIREMVFKHELTAFFATLFFILPTPIFKDGQPLVRAVLSGDGGHAVAFSLIPALLIAVRSYLANGWMKVKLVTIFGAAAVAIISLFGFVNFLIIVFLMSVSEGFMGRFRVKIKRFFSMFFFSVALSFFWYYPKLLSQVLVLDNIQLTLQKFWRVLPLAIPIVPVVGAVSFLIFDRREKLKPVFVGFSLFVIYLILYKASQIIQISGIFTAERYLIELSFATSFLVALVLVVLVELFIRKHVFAYKGQATFLLYLLLGIIILVFVVIVAVIVISSGRAEITTLEIIDQYHIGPGTIQREFNLSDPSTDFAIFVSVAASIFLVFKSLRRKA